MTGHQAGVTINDTGNPLDGTEAPVIFLGDPYTGKKDWNGAITLLGVPAVTNPLTADADNTVTFSAQAREVWVRNPTSVDLYVEFDAAASTAAWLVAAGEVQVFEVKVTVVHVWPVGSAVSVNAANGVSIRGGV